MVCAWAWNSVRDSGFLEQKSQCRGGVKGSDPRAEVRSSRHGLQAELWPLPPRSCFGCSAGVAWLEGAELLSACPDLTPAVRGLFGRGLCLGEIFPENGK